MRHIQSCQAGATLLVCLIILALMSAFAATSFNLGKSSLQIADNLRQQKQALAVAQETLETVISNVNFTKNPSNVFHSGNNNCPSGVTAPANSQCVDVNGDGKGVFVSTLTPAPTCVRWRPVLNNLRCTSGSGSGQSFGVTGSNTSGSLCADSLWEISAQTSEAVSNTEAAVTEGVSVQIFIGDVATNCPAAP